MNARISILCLGVLILSRNVSAQPGYVRKGAAYIQGEVSDQGLYKNNRQLLFTEKTKTVSYSPEQVEEYGTGEGDVYVKRMVHDGKNSTAFFLLRLVEGDRKLYELKEQKGSRFFIERDSSLVEIERRLPLKSQLDQQLRPCGSSQQFGAFARYGEASLKRVVMLSNACYPGFFPRRRMGILAGYEFRDQSLETITGHLFLQASALSPLVGVFIDVPLGISRSWFLTAQATYQQNNFSTYQTDNNVAVEFQDNFSTVGFPLLLKCRGTSTSWRPFIGFGPTPSINWQQQNAWLSTTYDGSTVYLNQGSWDNVKKFQISGTLCAGLEYSITPAKAVSLEFRLKKLIDAQAGPTQSFALLGSFYF